MRMATSAWCRAVVVGGGVGRFSGWFGALPRAARCAFLPETGGPARGAQGVTREWRGHMSKASSSLTRAGESRGGSVGRPRWSRSFRTTTPSLISAINLRRPPQ